MRAELDVFRYGQASTDQAERMLRDAYEIIHDRTMRGLALPSDPVAVVEHKRPEFTPVSPEQARSHFVAIRELLQEVAP